MKGDQSTSKPNSYYLPLTKYGTFEYPKNEIIQIFSGTRIFFHVKDISVIGAEPVLLMNLPLSKDEKFFYPDYFPHENQIPTENDNLTEIQAKSSGLGGIFFEVKIQFPGSFFFQIKYKNKENAQHVTKPDWIIAHPNKGLPSESMILLSVLTRCLGKLDRWIDVLAPQAKIGYNAIHFMPMQEYAESGSMYSLKNHLTVDDWYFDNPEEIPYADRLEKLKTVVSELNKKYGFKCLVDIIPNHVSPACKWLKEHPDAGYNLVNTPHLRVAWEYDKFLKRFSDDFVDKKFPECPSAPYINNENDLQQVMKCLEKKTHELTLYEYFYYNKEEVKEKFIKHSESFPKEEEEKPIEKAPENDPSKEDKKKPVPKPVPPKTPDSVILDYLSKHSSGYGIAPYGVTVDLSDFNHKNVAWDQFYECLEKQNNNWKHRYEGFMKESIQHMTDTTRYEKLERKLNKITKDCPIVYAYFTEFENSDPDRNPLEYVLAHNGWTEITEDFIGKNCFHYLRRNIGIWHCIKLRYGNEEKDSPFIWDYMTNYVCTMASIFQGFRIDNCHSTPPHVLGKLIRKARAVNPELFVYAELYAGGLDNEMLYVKTTGLNSLMRELIYVKNANDLLQSLWRDGTTSYGNQHEKIEFEKGKELIKLSSSRVRPLLYDLTHDNPSPAKQWNAQAVLPLICASGFSQTSVGSTLAADFLLPEYISVVYERRLYQILDTKGFPSISELTVPLKAEDLLGKRREIEINYQGKGTKISVLGGFNNWSKTANLMENMGNDQWKAKLVLPPGKYPYKFLIDDKDWVLGLGETLKDYSGNVNNVLTVENDKLPEPEIYENIAPIRSLINELHTKFGVEKAGFNCYQHEDMLIIHRNIGKLCYVLIERTHFVKSNVYIEERVSKTIDLPGKVHSVLFASKLYVNHSDVDKFKYDSKIINGLKGKCYLHKGIEGLRNYANIKRGSKNDVIEFHYVPCNLCLVLITQLE